MLARRLEIAERVVEIEDAPDQLLEALYTCAVALLYPSLSEGFGWPIVEAQACGCPVICTNLPPMPETAGDAGLFRDPADEAGHRHPSQPAPQAVVGSGQLGWHGPGCGLPPVVQVTKLFVDGGAKE